MAPASSPAWRESRPSEGDTVCTVWGSSCTGSEPYRSTSARLRASDSLKSPVICALPLNSDCWMVGADCTIPSRAMASRPVGHFSPGGLHWAAASSKACEPRSVNVRSTLQVPPRSWTRALASSTAVPRTVEGPSR
jgi:hypothetical protein